MNPHLKRTCLLVLSAIIIFFAAFQSVKKHNDASSLIFPQKKEHKNDQTFYPQEYFFLDRNYPEFTVPDDLFQRRVKQAVNFDKTNPRSHRGLDYPWTVQGPGNIGGRINTIAINPNNSKSILMGFSNGGVYKSKDGGDNWFPVFDDQASLSISHISYDPHNPVRVYAATGDVNISGYPFIGSGVYRSNNDGATWEQIGLADKGVLSKVVVDLNADSIIYVGSMGFPSHKGDEKGLYRSIDEGQSWQKTLTIDDSTGVIDIVTDPTTPGRVFASTWTRIRTNTYSTLVGPGTSLYRSDDYGATWINLIDDLPGDYHSRTGLEMANDGALFISYVGVPTQGDCSGDKENIKAVFKSVNGGMNWDTVRLDDGLPCDMLAGFGWYFEVLKVNPENSNELYMLGVDLYRSTDGGNTWDEFAPIWWFYDVHADKHDLVFNGDDIFLATDGGAYKRSLVSPDDSWEDIENIPSTQFYRTTFNPHVPDHFFGGAQDNGTTGGNVSIINNWPRLFGGDGFQPLFDPDEPDWIYTLTQNGNVWYSNDGGFNFEEFTDSLKGTTYWDMPFAMSSHDSKILFAASNRVYTINMNDTARYWKPISPDLTKGVVILGDRYPAITALAQSDLDANRLYAGTQDGKLWTTADGGENWIDLSEGTPGQFVTSITTSTKDPLGVYVTYSGYRDNDHSPYIYASDNAGETWRALGTNIPMLGVNNLLILPDWHDEILFAATDGGVYVSMNAGSAWERLGSNFPYMPVYDLEYNPVVNQLVAATFSRGLMTFPIEELDLVSSVEPVATYLDEQIMVYPTLAVDHVIIDFEKYIGTEKEFQIALVSISGVKIYEELVDVEVSKQVEIEWDRKLLGIHLLSISNKEGSMVKKVIIQ